MAELAPTELKSVELQIRTFKREIDDTLVRFHTDSPWSRDRLWNLRAQMAEISLKNCRAIQEYVSKTSEPAANEIGMRRRSAMRKLRTIQKSRDLATLNKWYKEELAPLLNKAEQAAYLVATSIRKATGDDSNNFTWQLQEPSGVEEHVKLYGKRADQFRYLDKACPVCGGRIDEKGWCGCGNIGGG